MLGPVEKALLAALIFVLMLGMGAGLTALSFREIARQPFAPLVGLLSRFGYMPLIVYLLATALALPPPMAISLLVVRCVPDGTTSNLFVMYAHSEAPSVAARADAVAVAAVCAAGADHRVCADAVVAAYRVSGRRQDPISRRRRRRPRPTR